jgi:hypothetical protein
MQIGDREIGQTRDVKLTFSFYTLAVSADSYGCSRRNFGAILSHAVDNCGLKAD